MPPLHKEDFDGIEAEMGGFCIDSLMRTILQEGYQMDELEFVTGIVDEMMSTALESYCQSYGVDPDSVDSHELGSTVRMFASTSVQALAEIALAIRDTLINLNIPMISDLDVCAYQFVGSEGRAMHIRKISTQELKSILRFREDHESCLMLSKLQISAKSRTLY